VEVDEEGLKVRPVNKRCIVIMREVAENTAAEEIKVGFKCKETLKEFFIFFAYVNVQ
jgi:hypothetical protein